MNFGRFWFKWMKNFSSCFQWFDFEFGLCYKHWNIWNFNQCYQILIIIPRSINLIAIMDSHWILRLFANYFNIGSDSFYSENFIYYLSKYFIIQSILWVSSLLHLAEDLPSLRILSHLTCCDCKRNIYLFFLLINFHSQLIISNFAFLI